MEDNLDERRVDAEDKMDERKEITEAKESSEEHVQEDDPVQPSRKEMSKRELVKLAKTNAAAQEVNIKVNRFNGILAKLVDSATKEGKVKILYNLFSFIIQVHTIL